MGRLSTSLALKVGQAIRERRKKLRVTQKAFAARCGITENYLGLVERGFRTPSLDLLVTFSKALRSKARDLVPF